MVTQHPALVGCRDNDGYQECCNKKMLLATWWEKHVVAFHSLTITHRSYSCY